MSYQFLGPPPSLCTADRTRSATRRQLISEIADNGGVDQLGKIRRHRRARQRPAVEGMHARGQCDARYQPNSLRRNKISDTQGAVVAVIALGASNTEQCLLGGAAQDR